MSQLQLHQILYQEFRLVFCLSNIPCTICAQAWHWLFDQPSSGNQYEEEQANQGCKLKRLKRIVEIGDERTLKNYLKYLEDGGIITLLAKRGSRLGALEKPEKIYLNNPNQIYAISGRGRENMGTIRETFFINALSPIHNVSTPKKGDFFLLTTYISLKSEAGTLRTIFWRLMTWKLVSATRFRYGSSGFCISFTSSRTYWPGQGRLLEAP